MLAGLVALVLIAGLLIAWLALGLAAQSWKRRYQASLQEASARLRGARRSLLDTERAAQAYPADGSPLYDPDLARLRQDIRSAKDRYPQLAAQLHDLRNPFPERPSDRWLARVLSGPREVFYLWRASRRARGTQDEVVSFERQVAQAREGLEALSRVTRDVAERCAQAHAETNRLVQVCAELRAAGLHGTDLDRVAGVVERLAESLRQLPGCFSSPGLDGVEAGATPESALQAWQALDEMEAPLRLCAEQLDGWQGSFEALRASQASVEMLFSAVARSMGETVREKTLPIEWGPDEQELARISEVKARLSQSAARRTADELARDLTETQDLRLSLQSLSSRVDRACAQRRTLLELMARSELRNPPGWLERARALQAEAVAWAADNWPSRLGAHRLGDDAVSLNDRREQWAQVDPAQPLSPAELDEAVSQLQALVDRMSGLPQRLDEAAGRLEWLKREEAAAFARLEPAAEGIGRLLRGLHRAEPPLGSEIDSQRQALERLHRQAARLLSEFEQRSSGLVADKVQRLQGWSRSCLEILHALRQTIVAEADQWHRALIDQVQDLRELAPLDHEEPMRLAERLLAETSRVPGVPVVGRAERSVDPAALAEELHNLLEQRARHIAASQALRSAIARPLEYSRQMWEQARADALASRQRLERLKRAVESEWPQHACDLRPIDSLLQSAARIEAGLRTSGHTLADVRRTVEELARNYRQIGQAIEECERLAQQEQANLQDLTSEIVRWRGQLRAFAERAELEPAAALAVDMRIAEIDQGLADLQRQWQATPLPAAEARRQLEALWNRVCTDMPVRGTQRMVRVRDVEAYQR